MKLKRIEIAKALKGTPLDYVKITGKSLNERYSPIDEYGDLRGRMGVNFSTTRVVTSLISPYVEAEISMHPGKRFLNFSSQDYLGLSQHQAVRDAAMEAVRKFGVHTASSPILTGRNKLTEQLEETLANHLGTEQCLLYPTGWGACFGAIAALVNRNDHLIMDALSHNSLQTAARYAVESSYKFRHNDIDNLESLLKKVRAHDSAGGVFVVVEGLYSMNSDMPDLPKVLDLMERYEAVLILDIAHDFGAMGEEGLGILEAVKGRDLSNVVMCGAFSKSFASNGGFVAGPSVIRRQLIVFSPSYTFSNGISPVQCAVAEKCAEIIFSGEGDKLRKKLKINIDHSIRRFADEGFVTIGIPSPIVPVLIGAESLARLMCREIEHKGILANLAEFPAVPKGKAIFRFQMMSTHELPHIDEAARIMAETRSFTETILKNLKV